MIGLLLRKDYTPSLKEAYIMYESIVDMVYKYGMNVIGIVPSPIEKAKSIIDICDGVILSGGSIESIYDKDIIKYIYDNDIPCLGICMGMQEMGLLFNGKLKKINNHYNCNHDVLISDSKILSNGIIKVNSRHHEILTKTNIKIVGKTTDNKIEMIEDSSKKFFVGVQWHPENLNDEISNKIFDTFFEKINKKSL